MSGERKVWEVVGGVDKGGILVREGKVLKSAALADRLATGSRILELAVEEGRLHYNLLEGSGPKEGWVNVKLGDKDLLVKVEELEETDPGEEAAPDEAPRHLRPASETAAPGLLPVNGLPPFMPAPNAKEAKRRAQLRLKGDMYGLPLPATPAEFESPSYGAGWLTLAFRAAGSIAEDNSVTRIVSAKNFPGGGSGPKTLFTVEYEKPDESLDTTLFMKLPAEFGATGSGVSTAQQRQQDIMGIFGDIWGAEVHFYRFVSPFIPFPVPKYYFGDMSRESTEAVIITSAVEWPKHDKRKFGLYQVRPACEKCEDYTLSNSQDYYFALMKRLGTVAGLEKTGRLGSDINKIEWSPYGPNMRGIPEGMALHFRKFVEEVAPHIWPAKVKSKEFLDNFMEAMDLVQKVAVPAEGYLYSNPLYIGFGHQNGNSDNAFFYTGADRALECGIFDWGSAGRMAYASELLTRGRCGSNLAYSRSSPKPLNMQGHGQKRQRLLRVSAVPPLYAFSLPNPVFLLTERGQGSKRIRLKGLREKTQGPGQRRPRQPGRARRPMEEFMGSFGSCLGEMLAEYDDRLMHAFTDAYHATGAEPIDVGELIMHYRLAISSNTCQMLGMVMPYLSEKHPQGRPFWKRVKAYNDEQIRSVFALKFGVSMLYNKVVLMSLRLDAYWETIMEWVKRMGW